MNVDWDEVFREPIAVSFAAIQVAAIRSGHEDTWQQAADTIQEKLDVIQQLLAIAAENKAQDKTR